MTARQRSRHTSANLIRRNLRTFRVQRRQNAHDICAGQDVVDLEMSAKVATGQRAHRLDPRTRDHRGRDTRLCARRGNGLAPMRFYVDATHLM